MLAAMLIFFFMYIADHLQSVLKKHLWLSAAEMWRKCEVTE